MIEGLKRIITGQHAHCGGIVSTTTPAVSVDLEYTMLLVAEIISQQFLYCPVTACPTVTMVMV